MPWNELQNVQKISDFQLDSRLATDCIQLGYLSGHSQATMSVLLLMNNAELPWFVIVPMAVDVIDIDELPEQHQLQMLKDMNTLSAFLKRHYKVDKINFASIGNIVNQMHFHLVARSEQDMAWPGVVWGTKACKKYQQDDIESLKNKLSKEINFFIVS